MKTRNPRSYAEWIMFASLLLAIPVPMEYHARLENVPRIA